MSTPPAAVPVAEVVYSMLLGGDVTSEAEHEIGATGGIKAHWESRGGSNIIMKPEGEEKLYSMWSQRGVTSTAGVVRKLNST